MRSFQFEFEFDRMFISGLAFASVTVPLMWIAVVNQNLNPLGMNQVKYEYFSPFQVGLGRISGFVAYPIWSDIWPDNINFV